MTVRFSFDNVASGDLTTISQLFDNHLVNDHHISHMMQKRFGFRLSESARQMRNRRLEVENAELRMRKQNTDLDYAIKLQNFKNAQEDRVRERSARQEEGKEKRKRDDEDRKLQAQDREDRLAAQDFSQNLKEAELRHKLGGQFEDGALDDILNQRRGRRRRRRRQEPQDDAQNAIDIPGP